MSDETILRERARLAMRTGKMPRTQPERTWGGPGAGERCAVCNESIGRTESEFELQFAGVEKNPHIHVRCFAAWEFERQHGPTLPQGGEDGTMSADEYNHTDGAG